MISIKFAGGPFFLYSSHFILLGIWHFQAAKEYLDLNVHLSFSFA